VILAKEYLHHKAKEFAFVAFTFFSDAKKFENVNLWWAEEIRTLTFVYQTILYQIKARCAEREWSRKLLFCYTRIELKLEE